MDQLPETYLVWQNHLARTLLAIIEQNLFVYIIGIPIEVTFFFNNIYDINTQLFV